ncbi:MAG: DUF3140 domain-containing protein [Mycobacterium sp.]
MTEVRRQELHQERVRRCGQHDRESTGHESGRHIIKVLKAKKSDRPDNDYAHMRKVVGYTKRHLAQRPSGNVKDTPWRYSLMNWGHDPVKK